MNPLHVRKFHISDAELLDQSEKTLSYLLIHKAAFQRKYGSVITDEWIATLTQMTAHARSLPSDIAMRGHQARETAVLKSLKTRFEGYYEDIIRSVERAYPDDPDIQSAFGIDRKKEILASHGSLHTYLSDLNSFWVKHGVTLVANGCPATMGDDILALERDVSAQKVKQGTAFDDRHTKTDDRIITLNTIFDNLMYLEGCAESLFGKKSATALLFHVYRGPRAKADEIVPPKPTVDPLDY